MTKAAQFPDGEEIVLKPSVEYFSHEAPEAFKHMKCIATNATADIVFGLRADFANLLDTETGVVTIEKTHGEIAKYHVKSGDSCVLALDPRLATEDLSRIIDFYVLNDFLGVLVTYNRIDYVLKQHLLVFDHTISVARKTYERKLLLNGLTFDVNVGLGELCSGRISVSGSRGPMDGDREVVAYSLSADPRPWGVVKYPDINLTTQIANFVSLLKADNPKYDIFSTGIFLQDNYIYFLVKQQERSVLLLHTIGRMKLCEKGEDEKKISKDRYTLLQGTGLIKYMGGICSGDLDLSVQRGRSVWLSFSPPDYDQLNTVSWRFYYMVLPYIARAIIFGITCSLRLQSLDNGWSLRCILKTLQWLYGPTMTPTIAPPNTFQLYNLDLKTFVYKKVEYEEKSIKLINSRYTLPVILDSDARGGLLMLDAPNEMEQQLNIRYFSPPHTPETLSRLCHNMIYRNYPSFEKSELVRRSLGVCDFRWRL